MRVIAYVDGFNLYAGICEFLKKNPGKLPHNKINLRYFIRKHMLHEGETLATVRWYSAIPPENFRDPELQAKIDRHHQYRRNLERSEVTVRISGFKKRPVRCKHCGKVTKHKQEKESDKRCSLEMLEDALYDRMDRALLFSSDSDFVPVLHSLKRYSSIRPIDTVVCPPIGRESPARDLLAASKQIFSTAPRYMRANKLCESLFEADTTIPSSQ